MGIFFIFEVNLSSGDNTFPSTKQTIVIGSSNPAVGNKNNPCSDKVYNLHINNKGSSLG